MSGLIRSLAKEAIALLGRESIDVLLAHLVVKVLPKCFCLYHRLGLLLVVIIEASRE